MKVVATGSTSCKVVVESSSRSILNLINFGFNKENLNDLSDYIGNEVSANGFDSMKKPPNWAAFFISNEIEIKHS